MRNTFLLSINKYLVFFILCTLRLKNICFSLVAAASLGKCKPFSELWKVHTQPNNCCRPQTNKAECGACAMCILLILVKKRDGKEERLKIAEILISHLDKDVLLQTRYGYTVLTWALNSHQNRIARLLLGCDIGKQLLNIGTPSPLWIAANEENVEGLRILLDHERCVDIYYKAPDGTTPLMMGIAKGNQEALEILRQFYPEQEITRINVEFGKADHFERSSPPVEFSKLALQSGRVEMVKKFSVEDLNHTDIPNLNNLDILKFLGRDTAQLSSPLTRLSGQFLFFNEKVEVKAKHNQIKKNYPPTLDLTDLKNLSLGKFCCIPVREEKTKR